MDEYRKEIEKLKEGYKRPSLNKKKIKIIPGMCMFILFVMVIMFFLSNNFVEWGIVKTKETAYQIAITAVIIGLMSLLIAIFSSIVIAKKIGYTASDDDEDNHEVDAGMLGLTGDRWMSNTWYDHD
jgi:ABC-type Fe3+ transport system permease subunit